MTRAEAELTTGERIPLPRGQYEDRDLWEAQAQCYRKKEE